MMGLENNMRRLRDGSLGSKEVWSDLDRWAVGGDFSAPHAAADGGADASRELPDRAAGATLVSPAPRCVAAQQVPAATASAAPDIVRSRHLHRRPQRVQSQA